MLLLHTDSLGNYGLHRVFQLAAEAGYDGIELGVNAKNLDTQNPKYLKKLSEETDVKIVVVQTPTEVTEKKMEITYKVAKEVEAGTIIVQPPKYFDYGSRGWIGANIPKLRNSSGMKIAMLNTANESIFGIIPKNSFSSTKDLRDFKQIALDVSNLVSRGIPLLEYYEKMKNYIFHIHLSNYRGSKDHALPPEGRLPIESLLKKMKKHDYTGHFSVKVRPTELKIGRSDDEVVEKLVKVKKFFEEYFS